MHLPSVVPDLDVLEDRGFGLCSGLELGPLDEFDFQRVEEALSKCVVVAVPASGHTLAVMPCSLSFIR